MEHVEATPSLLPSEDPNHHQYLSQLLPDELAALKQLEQNLLEVGGLPPQISPQVLMTFIWARKLEVDRAQQLFMMNRSIRKEIKASLTRIDFNQLNRELISQNGLFLTPQNLDKENRLVVYVFLGRMNLSRFPVDDILVFLLWIGDHCAFHVPPECHRNGMVVVQDFSNVGFHSINRSVLSAIKHYGANSPGDLLAGRIKAILVLNPPFIFKALIQIIRLFFKAKLLERMVTVTSADIMNNFISAENLSVEVGGNLEFTSKKFFEQIAHESGAQ